MSPIHHRPTSTLRWSNRVYSLPSPYMCWRWAPADPRDTIGYKVGQWMDGWMDVSFIVSHIDLYCVTTLPSVCDRRRSPSNWEKGKRVTFTTITAWPKKKPESWVKLCVCVWLMYKTKNKNKKSNEGKNENTIQQLCVAEKRRLLLHGIRTSCKEAAALYHRPGGGRRVCVVLRRKMEMHGVD